MNRLLGLALIGGFLASSAAASGAAANQVAHEANAHRAALAVQARMASAVQPLQAPAPMPAPANTTQRIIHATQVQTHAALPPAATELVPASQAAPSLCPPARLDIACRKP